MASEDESLRGKIRHLYFGDSATAQRFRTALIVFDLATIAFFLVTAMMAPRPLFEWLSYGVAVVLIADYAARLTATQQRMRFIFSFISIADLIVIASLLAAAVIENLAFLRILRTLRLLRSYQVLKRLRHQSRWFQRNEAVIESSINLAVFIFVITAIVFVLQADRDGQIDTYLDALYFTVTTLTTTGFGDITMTGATGRLLAVVIMVVGVGLFLRLIQTIFRPNKVRHTCPTCGLDRHDPDSVHCKHCGEALKIYTHGEWH